MNAAESGPAVAGLPEFSDAGVYVIDESGRIVAVNDRAEVLTGRPASGMLGRDAHGLLHRTRDGERFPSAACRMTDAVVGGRTLHGDTEWLERGDGSLLEASWLVTPCRIAGGGRGATVIFYAAAPATAVPSDTAVAATGPARATESLSDFDRLALLAETTTRLTSTLDVEETLERLVELVLPRIGDWAVVDLITDKDEVRRAAVVHYDAGVLVKRQDLQVPMPPVPQESTMPLSRALRAAKSALTGPETYRGEPDSGLAVAQHEIFEVTGMHSAAIAPIRGMRNVLGALTLGRSDNPEPLTRTELTLLEDIGRRAGLALENAQLYQRQRKVAETMQRYLLPQLPRIPGIEMTTRYVSAPDASHVGGDWYDAFGLNDGATALVIGDVAGHDLEAAAGMAQVRNILRAYAWSYKEPASAIVDRVDRALTHITEVSMATLVLARLEPVDGQWRLNWVNAGHLPPLLVSYDGRARFLEDGHGPLLGTGAPLIRPDATVTLPPQSTLLLYTDGLVESPGRHIDEGLALLRRHAASLAHRPLEEFCDRLLSQVRPVDNDDDVAVMALRPGRAG